MAEVIIPVPRRPNLDAVPLGHLCHAALALRRRAIIITTLEDRHALHRRVRFLVGARRVEGNAEALRDEPRAVRLQSGIARGEPRARCPIGLPEEGLPLEGLSLSFSPYYTMYAHTRWEALTTTTQTRITTHNHPSLSRV